MFRPLAFLALTVLLALAAVACAGDETTSGTQTTAAGATLPPVSHSPAVPAVAPPDQEAYRQSIRGRGLVQETCTYDADEGVADCEARGRYALNPPPTSPEASCVVGLAGPTPEYVACSVSGGAAQFYDIQS
jgi:hypothetical protein